MWRNASDGDPAEKERKSTKNAAETEERAPSPLRSAGNRHGGAN